MPCIAARHRGFVECHDIIYNIKYENRLNSLNFERKVENHGNFVLKIMGILYICIQNIADYVLS